MLEKRALERRRYQRLPTLSSQNRSTTLDQRSSNRVMVQLLGRDSRVVLRFWVFEFWDFAFRVLDSRASISCFQISTTFLTSLSSSSLRSRHKASCLYLLNVSALSVTIKYYSICCVTKFCGASFLCFQVLLLHQHSGLKDDTLVPNFIIQCRFKDPRYSSCLRSPFSL